MDKEKRTEQEMQGKQSHRQNHQQEEKQVHEQQSDDLKKNQMEEMEAKEMQQQEPFPEKPETPEVKERLQTDEESIHQAEEEPFQITLQPENKQPLQPQRLEKTNEPEEMDEPVSYRDHQENPDHQETQENPEALEGGMPSQNDISFDKPENPEAHEIQESDVTLEEPEDTFEVDLVGEPRKLDDQAAPINGAQMAVSGGFHATTAAPETVSDTSSAASSTASSTEAMISKAAHLPIPKGHRLLPRRTLFTMLLAAVLAGAVLSFALFYAMLPTLLQVRGIATGGGNQGSSVVIQPHEDLTVYSAVAQKAMPSVVGITTVQMQQGFFSGPQRSEGLGTGVIVDERGYILTNSHVIRDGQADEVMVLLHDGSQLPAEVLWFEQSMDLAVIKIEGAVDLVPAELGNSDELIVGEIVVAIGNPLGLNFERTLTQGVISGLNRSIAVSQNQIIDNLIQTDASINPGNSGGPLLNARGQVIGINTAKIQTGEGLGFSIPINTSKPIVDQFIERGEFRRVYLGIRGFNAENVEDATGVPLSVDKGVYIVEVVPESAAEVADLRPGDVVIALGDQPVQTMGELIRELYKYRPGDETTVTYLRNTREETVTIVLQD
ncbi:serine protease HtrA [Anoxynatronum buryatiense]|uniref:Serine protease, S1-C subfamily, contains C-terminal PDZ domain n=1 Tax=Anoxynatronum buryatiense TaxID=489973 RepID=A0AA45WWP0_9CLOT|nr:trypsin-like peptidase domain-containing protein [Anoxynatronum buryatiense]SMP58729.1 serine protease, S1-C subfamily, contains C-terminal PDZ domain [Anoxynatronum buryatiense]